MPRASQFLPFALLCAAIAMAEPGRAADEPAIVDFENELQPMLTRFGCNSGSCHGKARGQGGFQLSLLGFDPQQDYDAIVKEGRGRRVFAGAPENSLLLTKPTARVPHGGGKRLEAGGAEYQALLNWVRQGLPRKALNAAMLESIEVIPAATLLAPEQTATLTVTANYSDGSCRDVTRLTAFQSNEAPIAAVDEFGQVTAGRITGDAAIMARFMGQIAVCEVTIPRTDVIAVDVYATCLGRISLTNSSGKNCSD